MSKLRGPWPASPRRVISALTVVLVLTGWWFLLRPASLGGPTTLVTVTGQSMEPGMHTGDLAVVYESGRYAPGDVVAFAPDGRSGVVIHRIVDGSAEPGFRMRGDNNDFYDPWRPTADDITGELVLHVPGAGKAVMAMADPLFGGAAAAALTVFVVLAGGGRKQDDDEQAAGPSEAEVSA